MALPEVKKQDKVATRKIAEGSDLSVAAPALNKLFDTIRNNDQKENRFLTKHIDGESSEYTLIQDNNTSMLNILSSQSITESLLGTMKDTVDAGSASNAVKMSSSQILKPTKQEIQQKSNERSTEKQKVVPSAPVTSSGSMDIRSVPRVVSESVKKIDNYVSTQSGETKFSELKTINEETEEALERSASLLSNINESIQRQNRLLEETIENLKTQLEEIDKGDDDNLPNIDIDLDRRRPRRERSSRSSQRPSTGSRTQPRGSVPQVRPLAAPSRPNVVGGIVSGLVAGVAAEGATSYLTGKDEGLSAALLGLSPVATGVVGAAAGIKGAFELAENLTPEERKGAIDPLKKAELAIAEKLKIKFIKNIAPFKAGDVVNAKDIIKEFEVEENQKVEFLKQLFDTKQIDVASITPVASQVPAASMAIRQTTTATVEGSWSFNEFIKKDPESADKYNSALKEEIKKVSEELKSSRIKPNMSPSAVADELQYIGQQAKIIAETNILPLFADRINRSGAGNLKVNNTQATPVPQAGLTPPVPQVPPVPQAGLTPPVPQAGLTPPVPQVSVSVSAIPVAETIPQTPSVSKEQLYSQLLQKYKIEELALVQPGSGGSAQSEAIANAERKAREESGYTPPRQAATPTRPDTETQRRDDIVSQSISGAFERRSNRPRVDQTSPEFNRMVDEIYDQKLKEEQQALGRNLLPAEKAEIRNQAIEEVISKSSSIPDAIPVTPEPPVARVTPVTPVESRTEPRIQRDVIPEARQPIADRSKATELVNRLITISKKIENPDSRTLTILENITRMIQESDYDTATDAIDRLEKRISPREDATKEPTARDVFKERFESLSSRPTPVAAITPQPQSIQIADASQVVPNDPQRPSIQRMVGFGSQLLDLMALDPSLRRNLPEGYTPQTPAPSTPSTLTPQQASTDSNDIQERIKKTLSEYDYLLAKLDSKGKFADEIAKKIISIQRTLDFEKRKPYGENDKNSSSIISQLESNIKYYETLNQKRELLQQNVINEYASTRDVYENVRRILSNASGISENDIKKQAEEVFNKRNEIDKDKLKQFKNDYTNLEQELKKEPPKDFALVDTSGENVGITPIPAIPETLRAGITPLVTPNAEQQSSVSPPELTSKEYTIKRGDTLSSIAKNNNIKLEDILKANPDIKNPNVIKPGEKIKITGVNEKQNQPEGRTSTTPLTDKINKILLNYKQFIIKIDSNSKLNDGIASKIVSIQRKIEIEQKRNDAVSNNIITKLQSNLKYYTSLNDKRQDLEKRVYSSYANSLDEYSSIQRVLNTTQNIRTVEEKFKNQEKVDTDNLKQFEAEYENLVKLLNSEPTNLESENKPERRGDDATKIDDLQPLVPVVEKAGLDDAEPLDKDLLSTVSQSYTSDSADTGWQDVISEDTDWKDVTSEDTGWKDVTNEPQTRSMLRSTRSRRRTNEEGSDSLTINARDVIFKSDKMEAPFLDAIKEELSDFMNAIMNVSGSGAAVTPNLSGGGMSMSGGLASPVSFANISGGMRQTSTPSFGSDQSQGQQAQGEMQAGGTSEKPENVTFDSGVDVSKVDKDLLGSFYAAAKEYGKPVKINSGFRSDEKQAELWVRANVFKEPGIYMPAKPDKPTTINYKGQTFNVPGGRAKSSHGGSSSSARAIDVTRNALEEMDSMGLLRKYGLHRPFPNDPVHVERIGGRSAPPDTSTDGAQEATQVSASPATATASVEGGSDSSGETATPVASEASSGEAMSASSGGEQTASMTPSTPSSGPTVATASVDNEVAKRTPMTGSMPTPEAPSSGSSSPGVGDTSYPISMGDPGNVEPPDAAQRYALLFDMAA